MIVRGKVFIPVQVLVKCHGQNSWEKLDNSLKKHEYKQMNKNNHRYIKLLLGLSQIHIDTIRPITDTYR